MNISHAAGLLISALTDTNEYTQLCRARKALENNSGAFNALVNFQKKEETFLKAGHMSAQMQDYMSELEREYNKIILVPEIADYFKANESFGNLFTQTIGSIQASLQQHNY